jgi:hypothetical protein
MIPFLAQRLMPIGDDIAHDDQSDRAGNIPGRKPESGESQSVLHEECQHGDNGEGNRPGTQHLGQGSQGASERGNLVAVRNLDQQHRQGRADQDGRE